MKWFKNLFKRKSMEEKLKNLEPLAQLIEDKKEKNEWTPRTEYIKKGTTFKIGDKVIGRSNECDPLLIGEIVEFWDNEGKWDNCIPYVKDENGEVWGVMGHLVHYSDGLYQDIKDLRPLEQWNYFLPGDSPYRYTEKAMEKKEKAYKERQNFGQ
jgi:hypothetical protein